MQFKIKKNTPSIKVLIVEALTQNGLETITKNVDNVWNAFMSQCGIETDMCDALTSVFGGSLDDYDYDTQLSEANNKLNAG